MRYDRFVKKSAVADGLRDINVCPWQELQTEVTIGLASLQGEIAALEGTTSGFPAMPLPVASSDSTLVGESAAIAAVLRGGQQVLAALSQLEQVKARLYGEPQEAQVRCGGGGQRPGILVCGHDLVVLQRILEQSVNAGVDVYTQGELLAGHYYPGLRQYPHLYGQFDLPIFDCSDYLRLFRGALLLTAGCRMSYTRPDFVSHVFPCGASAMHEVSARKGSVGFDFTDVIAAAGKCPPPIFFRSETISGIGNGNGILHWQEMLQEGLADERFKHCFLVIGGGEGKGSVPYMSELFSAMPEGCLVFTAGCAGGPTYLQREADDRLGPLRLDIGQSGDCLGLALLARRIRAEWTEHISVPLPLSVILVWQGERAAALLPALRLLGLNDIWVTSGAPAYLRTASTDGATILERLGGRPTTEARTDLKMMLRCSDRDGR